MIFASQQFQTTVPDLELLDVMYSTKVKGYSVLLFLVNHYQKVYFKYFIIIFDWKD